MRYRSILEEDQAGMCTVAHESVPEFPVVALKLRPLNTEQQGRLMVTSHPNLVNIQHFYEEQISVWIAYECMAVALSEIQASTAAALKEYEWAAICKEVR